MEEKGWVVLCCWQCPAGSLRPTHSASLPWGRDVTPSLWGYHGDQLRAALPAHRQILALSTEDGTKAQGICCLSEQTPKPLMPIPPSWAAVLHAMAKCHLIRP